MIPRAQLVIGHARCRHIPGADSTAACSRAEHFAGVGIVACQAIGRSGKIPGLFARAVGGFDIDGFGLRHGD